MNENALGLSLLVAQLDDEETESSAALSTRARESKSDVAVGCRGEPGARARLVNGTEGSLEGSAPLESIEDVGGTRLGGVRRIDRLRNGLRERDV